MRDSILAVTIPPPSPGTPLGKASPSGPGVEEFFSSDLVPVIGGGANGNNYSSKELWGYIMASNFVDESTYFLDKSVEFVSE